LKQTFVPDDRGVIAKGEVVWPTALKQSFALDDRGVIAKAERTD
jgi:hypothetical protein